MFSGFKRVVKLANSPHFWAILIIFVFSTISYYPEAIGFPSLANGLTRHALQRLLYIITMIYAGYLWGFGAGLTVTVVSLVAMLPRDILISSAPADTLFETIVAVIIGIITNFWLRARAHQALAARLREEAIALTAATRDKLRAQIRNAIKSERELTALSRFSGSLAEAVEMEPLLRSATEMVLGVMGVEIVLISTHDEETGQLVLSAHQGVPPEFTRVMHRLNMGERFKEVAETGKPLTFAGYFAEPERVLETTDRENIRVFLTVSMKSSRKIIGTLTVASRQPGEFLPEEIELLTAIANQVGVGIESVRLVQQQTGVTERLRRSEKQYRELFELAHQAIWVHDLEGNILTANKATEKLSGYSIEELTRMKVRDFLLPENLNQARELRVELLKGENIVQPYEQRLIRRDGSAASLILTTNVISYGDQPVAFQNIARDITEEKKLQEDLRSYVRQITRAQEDERLRISRELHDSTAQNLIALLHRLESFLQEQGDLPIEKVKELWALHEQTKDILQEIRTLSRNLRPSILDDAGILPAVHLIVREMKNDYGIDATLEVHGTERRLSPEAELLVFRVIQEALRNAGRHSQGTKAEVIFTFEELGIVAVVKDNGVGLQVMEKMNNLSRGKLGIAGMQERMKLLGGTLEVKSLPGTGTWVIIRAPV